MAENLVPSEIEDSPIPPAVLQELRQVQVYQCRPDGVLIGFTVADESPLEPGNYLMPGYCVAEEPPTFGGGDRARWDWELQAWFIEPNTDAPPAEDPQGPQDLPADVSIRQFTQALAETGALTWDAARAWSARGEVPAEILDQVNAMEDDLEKNRTLMFLESAKSVEAAHQKTLQLAALMGRTEEQLFAILRYAATL